VVALPRPPPGLVIRNHPFTTSRPQIRLTDLTSIRQSPARFTDPGNARPPSAFAYVAMIVSTRYSPSVSSAPRRLSSHANFEKLPSVARWPTQVRPFGRSGGARRCRLAPRRVEAVEEDVPRLRAGLSDAGVAPGARDGPRTCRLGLLTCAVTALRRALAAVLVLLLVPIFRGRRPHLRRPVRTVRPPMPPRRWSCRPRAHRV
jgi:hypothetical protein